LAAAVSAVTSFAVTGSRTRVRNTIPARPILSGEWLAEAGKLDEVLKLHTGG
jgi:hypothetical protein